MMSHKKDDAQPDNLIGALDNFEYLFDHNTKMLSLNYYEPFKNLHFHCKAYILSEVYICHIKFCGLPLLV